MSKKIAPSLQELSKHGWNTVHLQYDGQEWVDETDAMWSAATAELRALLAVARAAKFWVDRREAASMLLPPECWKELDKGTMRAIRALARLSRVSGGKP